MQSNKHDEHLNYKYDIKSDSSPASSIFTTFKWEKNI